MQERRTAHRDGGAGGEPADGVGHGDAELEAKNRPQTFRDTKSLTSEGNSACTFHLFVNYFF